MRPEPTNVPESRICITYDKASSRESQAGIDCLKNQAMEACALLMHSVCPYPHYVGPDLSAARRQSCILICLLPRIELHMLLLVPGMHTDAVRGERNKAAAHKIYINTTSQRSLESKDGECIAYHAAGGAMGKYFLCSPYCFAMAHSLHRDRKA